MATEKQSGEAGGDGGRGGHPYYSLQKAVEFAKAVSELGGANGEVQKSMIAHHLKMDEKSATLIQTLGAAKTFGLLDGRGPYKLTEIGKKYFFPVNEGDSQQAILQALKMPTVFAKLIEKFDGSRVPTNDVLVNILHREHDVAESWRPRVASLFVTALQYAKAIDGAGFLRYKASLYAAGAGNLNPTKDSAPVPERMQPAWMSATVPSYTASSSSGPPPTSMEMIGGKTNVWSFKIGGESVRLETSCDFSYALWDKLNRYVQVIKPDQESAEKSPVAPGA